MKTCIERQAKYCAKKKKEKPFCTEYHIVSFTITSRQACIAQLKYVHRWRRRRRRREGDAGEVDSRRCTPGLISQTLTGDEEKPCFPSQHAASPQLG